MNASNNLVNKIKEWLTEQGYPLEMQVSNVLRRKGFEVIQSHYYPDPESNTYREIDVIATYPEHTGCINISFTIECKVSKKKPWILFSSSNVLEGNHILFTYCIHSKSARKDLLKELDIDYIKMLKKNLPWMKKNSRVAYGVTQAFTSGDDKTYKASLSALKAAINIKKEIGQQKWEPFVFIFPVIVIDGQLFDCFLDKKGKVSISEIYDSFLFFPLNIAGEFGTCIHILTVNQIEKFANQAVKVSKNLISLLKEDVDKKLKSI